MRVGLHSALVWEATKVLVTSFGGRDRYFWPVFVDTFTFTICSQVEISVSEIFSHQQPLLPFPVLNAPENANDIVLGPAPPGTL